VGIDVTGTTATSTYRGAGNRSAVCIVTDGHWFVVGRVDVTVLADVDNHQPVANLTAAALDTADTLSVTFDASGSEDPDGDPMEYAIDFGDGRWTSWRGEPTFNHTYEEAGTYQAILKVRDHTRFDGSYSVLSVDTEAMVPNAPPVARLEVDADPAAPFEDITANASLSTDPDGGNLEYRFDWGDGEVTQWSQDPVATHVYDEPGEYNITLTVRDDHGAEKDLTSTLEVVSDGDDDDDDGGFIPHPGVAITLAALIFAGILALMSPDRRKGP
jgi:PKD repeat protein